LQHRKTKEEILKEFLNNFEGSRGNHDGIVTWNEFCEYYSELSMSIPSDQYFVEMMETVWQVPEVEDSQAK